MKYYVSFSALFTAFLFFNSVPLHANWAHKQLGLDSPLDCSAVKIAFLDTGVDIDSTFLQNAIWINTGEIPGNGIDDDNNGYVDDIHGYNFIDNNSSLQDIDGHGTMVAHTIAGHSFHSEFHGVCRTAKIMVLKVSNSQGTSPKALKSALQYAQSQGAHITLLTTGLIIQAGLPPLGLKAAFKRLIQSGSVVVFAAANLRSALILPQIPERFTTLKNWFIPDRYSPLKGLISVGGSTELDLPWRGGFRDNRSVNVAAPAENIDVLSKDGNLLKATGNSLAAGLTAGALAAFWTQQGADTPSDQILNSIESSSLKKEAYMIAFRWGRLDLKKMLQAERSERFVFKVDGQKKLDIQTNHPYESPQEASWEFKQPGALAVRLSFHYIDLGNCWSKPHQQSKIIIQDKNGNVHQEIVCSLRNQKYQVNSVAVPGDTVRLIFQAKESHNLYSNGFSLRSLEWMN